MFNLDLPNEPSIVLPGSQSSYRFEHSCQEGGRKNVLIASNCNTGTMEYNLQDLVGKWIVAMY